MSEAEQLRNEGVAVERRDAPPWLIAALAAGLVVFGVLSVIGIILIYPSALRGPSDAPRLETTAPRLQIDPARDLAEFRAQEEKQLTTYGWIDQAHGTVRIPIERAMRDVVDTGIKDWPRGTK
jgi:hypothetical protein